MDGPNYSRHFSLECARAQGTERVHVGEEDTRDGQEALSVPAVSDSAAVSMTRPEPECRGAGEAWGARRRDRPPCRGRKSHHAAVTARTAASQAP